MNPNPKIIGSVGEPQGRRNGWSQTLGHYVEYIWKGSESYCQTVFGSLVNACAEVESEIDGGRGTVRARFAGSAEPGGEEQPRLEIRMTWNSVGKSIFEPSIDYDPGVSSDEMRQIKRLLDTNEDSDFTTWLETATPDGIDLYELALAGVENRIVYQPAIHRITTGSSSRQWQDINTHVGKVLSQDRLLAVLGSTPNFVIPGSTSTSPSGFFYGWKMGPAEYDTSSDGHSTETIEFEFGLWSAQLYTFVA